MTSMGPHLPAGAQNPNQVPQPRFQPNGNRMEYNAQAHREQIKDLDCTELQNLLRHYLYNRGHGNGNRGLMDRRMGMLQDSKGLGYGSGAPHQAHVDQYYAQQARAQDVIDKMDKDNCPPPSPQERKDAAKEPPSYQEYKDYQDANKSAFTRATEWAYDNRYAIGAGALVIGAGALTIWGGGWGAAAAGGLLAGGAAAYCVPGHTRILTPRGERPIASLALGDLLLVPDGDALVAVPILRIGRRPADAGVALVSLWLSDGRRLCLTPGHRVADGRRAGDLRPGDALGAARLTRVDAVSCRERWLYDVLPAHASGVYLAEGVALESALERPLRRAMARDAGVGFACHP